MFSGLVAGFGHDPGREANCHRRQDGATVARPRGGKSAFHLVSAWATANHLTLGQVAVSDKSNEITAIPRLLELLDLCGAVVTIDAMGCQKDIARKVREGDGH